MELSYILLFFASFLAATVVPFSSEVILSAQLVAGFDPILSLAVATIGNWLGGMSSYGLGWLGKWDWIEKYLKVPQEKILNLQNRIKGHERWIAFLCWLPFVGDALAIALGFLRTNLFRTAFWMLIGKALRYAVWGYLTIKTLELL